MADQQAKKGHDDIWNLLYEYADIRDELEDTLLSFQELHAEIGYAMEDITEELESLEEHLSKCSERLMRFRNPRHSHPDTIESTDISWSNSLTVNQSKLETKHEVINTIPKRHSLPFKKSILHHLPACSTIQILVLPCGNDGQIDETAAKEMIAYAMENGINYYDTAWGYHEGQSELVIGKLLKDYDRSSFYLATKFPGYDLSNMDKAESIFEKQLQKCQVEYFDFYLFHNVCEMNIDAYLDEKYDIYGYLMKQKKAGRIRHLGFSAHGSVDVMKRFLEAYGKDMEFCQIQLNYLDWSFQDAKAKVRLLHEYHIPVWVMEPLRGGRLASLPQDCQETLSSMRPDEKIPAWAFRFLQTLPEVTMVLSGMSNFQQLKENIHTFSQDKPLNDKEMAALLGIADRMLEKKILPCTACRYCTTHCPKGLDIPSLLALYNEHCFTEGGFIAPMAMMALEEEKRPSACIGCRSCEAVCPQQIKISEAMKDFAGKMG